MKKLKLSAPDWCFFPENAKPETYYAELKKLGYDAVEMADQSRWPIIRNLGLEIINLSGPGMTKGLNRMENHAELLPQIKDNIVLAGKNKIPNVIIFSGNREGQKDAEGIDNCLKGISELLPVAKANNVVLLFEMLCAHNHPDYQADKSAYGFEIVKRAKSPNIKVLYDIYHMERMNCDSIKDITKNLQMVGHIHIAESPKRDIPLRDGEIKYGKIVPAIVKAGYEGYWGMEFFPTDNMKDLKAAAELFNSFA